MAYSVINSKLVAERITVSFNFASVLEVTETITSHDVSISTLIGVDASPEDMLYAESDLLGHVVSQQVEAGTPGVIYEILCVATGSFGGIFEFKTKLAVLPSPEVVPDLIAVWYTTELYPIETTDQFTHSFAVGGGKLREMPFPLEMYTHSMEVGSGSLRDLLVSFDAPAEAYTHELAIGPGTLVDVLVEFDVLEEYTHSMNVISGTLEDKLVEYTVIPDQMQHSMTPLSGTLI